MKLWIANLPEVTDDELIEFVGKYGCPRPITIERIPGDGSRPAAALSFEGNPDALITAVQARLDGMFWKDRALIVQTVVRQ